MINCTIWTHGIISMFFTFCETSENLININYAVKLISIFMEGELANYVCSGASS